MATHAGGSYFCSYGGASGDKPYSNSPSNAVNIKFSRQHVRVAASSASAAATRTAHRSPTTTSPSPGSSSPATTTTMGRRSRCESSVNGHPPTGQPRSADRGCSKSCPAPPARTRAGPRGSVLRRESPRKIAVCATRTGARQHSRSTNPDLGPAQRRSARQDRSPPNKRAVRLHICSEDADHGRHRRAGPPPKNLSGAALGPQWCEYAPLLSWPRRAVRTGRTGVSRAWRGAEGLARSRGP